MPFKSSATRAVASTAPFTCWISMSWCSSDQSMPTKITCSPVGEAADTVRAVEEAHARPNGSVLYRHAIPQVVVPPYLPAGARSTLRAHRPVECSAHLPVGSDNSLPNPAWLLRPH